MMETQPLPQLCFFDLQQPIVNTHPRQNEGYRKNDKASLATMANKSVVSCVRRLKFHVVIFTLFNF